MWHTLTLQPYMLPVYAYVHTRLLHYGLYVGLAWKNQTCLGNPVILSVISYYMTD